MSECLKPCQTESQVMASLEMSTCAHRLVMGGQTELQVDASWTEVTKKPFQ